MKKRSDPRPREMTAPYCTSKCDHIAPYCGWPHDVMAQEDAGEIHTDDCGFNHCTHDHDPGECCTAGEPGCRCRVFSRTPPQARADRRRERSR